MKQELLYVLRILTAVACGALIGWERERHGKRAGLRTHMIIAASSALMMILSKYGFADVADTMGVDASRIAAGVITSIGFLGIGIIRTDSKTTVGLSTSAGLLATVAIGLTVGAGMYLVSIFTTGLIVLLQQLIHKDEKKPEETPENEKCK